MDAGVDYKTDYMQGRLLLSAPLSSVTDSTSVADFSGGKLIQRLFVSYEFTLTNLTLDRVTKGGRAEVSITNRLRLGISGYSQHTKDGPQSNRGLDLHYSLGANSALVLEHAQSDGLGLLSTVRSMAVLISRQTRPLRVPLQPRPELEQRLILQILGGTHWGL